MVQNSVKNHLKDTVHSFKYFAANCAEVAHLGSKMNNILLMMTMVEYVWMITNVIMNTAWLIITWHHRHSLTRDTWTPDLFSSQWDLLVLLGRSAGPPLILRVHSGMFVTFYVNFFILDIEDCQFTFSSTSFWVVLDFWVFSFGFWILRSVGPPLIAHLIWVVLDFFILSFLLWILQNVGPPLILYLNFGLFWIFILSFWLLILQIVSPILVANLFGLFCFFGF